MIERMVDEAIASPNSPFARDLQKRAKTMRLPEPPIWLLFVLFGIVCMLYGAVMFRH